MNGGLIAVGGLNLGGNIEQVYSAVGVAELAIEKGATVLLMPVFSRLRLFELSDEMATKIDVRLSTLQQLAERGHEPLWRQTPLIGFYEVRPSMAVARVTSELRPPPPWSVA